MSWRHGRPGDALALVCALILAGAVSSPALASERLSLAAIERQYMCVTCKIPLNVARSPQADRERAFIGELIDQGRSEGQIERALVAQYGSAVLALPPAHGFDLAVYLVPAVAVLALLGLLAVLLPSWRRRARVGDEGAPALPPVLTADQAARVQEDLERYG